MIFAQSFQARSAAVFLLLDVANSTDVLLHDFYVVYDGAMTWLEPYGSGCDHA